MALDFGDRPWPADTRDKWNAPNMAYQGMAAEDIAQILLAGRMPIPIIFEMPRRAALSLRRHYSSVSFDAAQYGTFP